MWMAMDFGGMFRLMPKTLLWLVIVAAWVPAASDHTDGQLTTPHESPPTMPWVRPPKPTASVAGSCQSHVVRDSFRSIQVNVDRRGCNILGDAANEPSIAVSLTDRRKMVIGWRQFNSVSSDFREPGWAYSHDGGHTWVFRGSLEPGVFGSDPVLASAPDGKIYYLSINFEEMRLFHSFESGLSRPLRTQVVPYFYDKPWMAVDATGGIGHGNIYITRGGGPFLRSIDRGQSFHAPTVSYISGDTVDVGYDGSVYLAYGYDPVGFGKSSTLQDANLPATFDVGEQLELGNGGLEFFSGNGEGRSGQVWLAIDQSLGATRGNVYVLTMATTDPVPGSALADRSDLVFTSSKDGGRTWSRRMVVNDDALSVT